tara:strand:- start:49 stop:786 length:738 start_codon:yes stop_codon:yes gene_type:complete
MKYILAFGIFFKKFSNSMQIRIFSDDLFIDEITLDENLLGKEKRQITHTRYHYATELLHPDKKEQVFKTGGIHMKLFPEKLFVYEIDESSIGKKILLEITDKNSNFTNGFMTSSNMFAIDSVFLFPKHMFSEKKIPRVMEFMRRIYNRDSLDNINTDAEVDEYHRKHVPWPSQAHILDADTKRMYDRGHWHGGAKRLQIEIKKKFGLHFLWNGRNESSNTIKFGNPREFIEYNLYYELINTINED